MPDDLKWATKTHMIPFTLTFKTYLTKSMVLKTFFGFFIYLPVHPYFYPPIFVFSRPNDGWMGLYIKLCTGPSPECLSGVFRRCRSSTLTPSNSTPMCSPGLTRLIALETRTGHSMYHMVGYFSHRSKK